MDLLLEAKADLELHDKVAHIVHWVSSIPSHRFVHSMTDVVDALCIH